MALNPNVNSREYNVFRDASDIGTNLARVAIEIENVTAPSSPNGSGGSTTQKAITTAVLAAVGSSNLANRSSLILEAADNGLVWSLDSGMTYYHKLFKDGAIEFNWGPGVLVYVKSTVGSINLVITEVARV